MQFTVTGLLRKRKVCALSSSSKILLICAAWPLSFSALMIANPTKNQQQTIPPKITYTLKKITPLNGKDKCIEYFFNNFDQKNEPAILVYYVEKRNDDAPETTPDE